MIIFYSSKLQTKEFYLQNTEFPQPVQWCYWDTLYVVPGEIP